MKLKNASNYQVLTILIWIRVDLPCLETINLGTASFSGQMSGTTLTMKGLSNRHDCLLDLPKLKTLTSKGFSFRYIRSVTLISNEMTCICEIDIPNLNTVQLVNDKQGQDGSLPFLEITKKHVESKSFSLILF